MIRPDTPRTDHRSGAVSPAAKGVYGTKVGLLDGPVGMPVQCTGNDGPCADEDGAGCADGVLRAVAEGHGFGLQTGPAAVLPGDPVAAGL